MERQAGIDAPYRGYSLNGIMAPMHTVSIHTDGGSRGNPGPAATGVVIGPPFGKEYSSFLGTATNNEAEYQAAILALQKVLALAGKKEAKNLHITMHMDSNLAVEQLSGNWKIEGETIIPLFIKIHNLTLAFGKISYVHVPREKNKSADALVNQELDKQTGAGSLFANS